MGIDPLGLVGSVIDGQVRVDEWIGEGGFSVVYRGVHLGLNEVVAIKCMKPLTDAPDVVADFVNRFRDESRIAYRLSQGNLDIVRCIASGSTNARSNQVPYMVLEWLEGDTLATAFRNRVASKASGLALEEAYRLCLPSAQALAYAHSLGVIHRDVKPGNLFLARARDGAVRLKVLDFGMAKFMADSVNGPAPNPGFSRLALSMGNVSVFSAHYAAPEQFDPTMGPIGAATDVYSFALVFMEVLTDRRVRAGASLAECLIHACKPSTPLNVRQWLAREPPLPLAVEQTLERALSTKPGERQQNMGQFLGELRNAMQGDPKQSKEPSIWDASDDEGADAPATIVAETKGWREEAAHAQKTREEEAKRAAAAVKPGKNLPQDVKDFLARTGAPGDRPSALESGTGRAAAIKSAGLPAPRPFARTIAGGFVGGQFAGKVGAPRVEGTPRAEPVKVTEAHGGPAAALVLPAIPARNVMEGSASPADMTTPHIPTMVVSEPTDSEPPTLAIMHKEDVGADRIPGQSDMPTMIGAPPALEIPKAASTGDWGPPPSQPMQAPIPGLPLPQAYGTPHDGVAGPVNPLARTMPLSAAFEQQAMAARAQAQQHMQMAATAPAAFAAFPGQPGQSGPTGQPQGAPYGQPPMGMGQPQYAPAGAPWQGGAPQAAVPKSRMMVVGVLAGMAVLLVLGLGYGAYSLFAGRANDPAVDGIDMTATAAATNVVVPPLAVSTAVPAPTTSASAATAPPAAADTASALASAAPAPTETTAPADSKPADSKPADSKPADTKSADTKSADTKSADSKPAAVAEKPKPAPVAMANTPKPASPPKVANDPTKFNPDAARASLRTMEGMLASCKKPDGPTGSGKARVTFANEGNVTGSAVVGAPYEGTPVGDCVATRFRFAKAPKFEGPPGVLDYSFSISR